MSTFEWTDAERQAVVDAQAWAADDALDSQHMLVATLDALAPFMEARLAQVGRTRPCAPECDWTSHLHCSPTCERSCGCGGD